MINKQRKRRKRANEQTNAERVELLEVLAKGCRVHPAYRAIRPATGGCLPCVDMWEARKKLNDIEAMETECCDDLSCCEKSGCC